MAKPSRFVKPGSTRLPLFGADLDDPQCEWIEVKSQITYGDQQALAAKLVDSIEIPTDVMQDDAARENFKQGLRMKLDIAGDGPAKILIWGIDWNLEDGDGYVVEFCMDSVLNLDTDTAAELNRVIDEHAKKVGAVRGKARRTRGQLKRRS